MAQKKAFVRYANNKAVAGSLIVREKAPKVGVWKEVDYDLCCGGGGGCAPQLSDKIVISDPITIPEETQLKIIVVLATECIELENEISITSNITTYEELVIFLNTNYSFYGLFNYTAPDKVTLQVSSTGITGQGLSACPDAEWILYLDIPTS